MSEDCSQESKIMQDERDIDETSNDIHKNESIMIK